MDQQHDRTCEMYPCGQLMSLAVQIYCPLNGSPYHRCLYVFACLGKTCYRESHGWRVFRSQLLDESVSYNYVSNIKSDQKDNKDVWGEGQDSWGDGQDNWGDDQEDWGETPQGNLNCKFDFHEGAQEYLENEAKQWGQEDKESVKTVLQNTIVPTVMTEESDDVNKDKCLTSRQPLEGIEALAQLSVKDPSDCGNTQLDSSPSSEVISSEELLVDEEGIHRMMELMAVPERDKPKEMQTICANNVVCLPAYYINVFEETTDDSELTSHVASLLHNYEEKEGKKVQALVEENRNPYGRPYQSADGEVTFCYLRLMSLIIPSLGRQHITIYMKIKPLNFYSLL
ncbi:programmed cell death protein 2-like isoform X3 [Pomacea canaliculata]|uniref:programmed cell death protein 2-like isoform X3 n=1 Tax=Pomacea canaliculata TaxID=400727 RepID=UPI000D733136|nr:programmed cell death protein 2-like isoform X3 [Pomacea canaliculata]